MNYKWIAPVILLFSFNSYSESSNYKTINRLNSMFVRNLNELNETAERCEKEQRKLPTEKLKALKIDKPSMRIALRYYYFNSIAECNNDAISRYLINSTLLQLMDDTSKSKVENAHHLVMNSLILLSQVKDEFDDLSSDKKRKLEAIDELKHPFDLRKEAESLELDNDILIQ